MVKEIKRIDTGKVYRNGIIISIFFFITIVFTVFYLGPGLDISGSEGFGVVFALLLPLGIMIFLLFGFYIYRYSSNWQVLCPVDDAEKCRDVNVEKIVERLRQRFAGRYRLVDSVDRYDRWFQWSGGEKLLSDDFVIYVYGNVNNPRILTINVNFRVLNKDSDKIERMKEEIVEVLEGFE